MAKYGKKSQVKVKNVMRKFKRGELKSGTSGKKVTSRKQAIAIGLSQARKEGAKVPQAPSKTCTTKKSTTAKSRTTTSRTKTTKKK